MTNLSENPVICFAHAAYGLLDAYDALPASERPAGTSAFQVASREELAARIGEADIVVASGLWDNALLAKAPRLRLVQSVSAGVNQFDATAFAAHGVQLASAQGANEQAVSEHAIAMLLALARRIHEARDNQARRVWRPMQSDHGLREDVIGGKTLVIIGLGRIGGRLARLAKAFGMHVIGVRRDPSAGLNGADEVVATRDLLGVLPRADYVALTCPLTDETKDIVDARALAAMKPRSILVNLARGGCVVEADLIAALRSGHLEAAGLDVTVEEPLPAASPLWEMPNVLVTPHTGGETRAYEASVTELLVENIGRLRRGERLVNQIV
ncbi:D-2-hydroxyacid dehydrogenase [Enterovirga rhinocerotis]|uniref:Phosphoglycerate dehydrogenase-like enzyme n=1 Tax=Enterovirga rhinocerotis TaxID=1339210 RepID=A0A4R7BT35_9HYPH|nr:D-2-hydroxyacid dehydrogenase [Enterovirga rhinocerotis]TDR87267.1 phosphoglycerate dehydrogenase-like enzyme [Enterovirga rhinocerotis]